MQTGRSAIVAEPRAASFAELSALSTNDAGSLGASFPGDAAARRAGIDEAALVGRARSGRVA